MWRQLLVVGAAVFVGAFAVDASPQSAAVTPAVGIPAVIRVHPQVVVLRDGKTTETLRVEVRDADGHLVPPADGAVTFTSSNPALVSVDAAGRVSATGFGSATITATAAGIPGSAEALVRAGDARVEPPIVLLAIAGASTAQLRVELTGANGAPIPLNPGEAAFQNWSPVVTVGPTGLVTAIRPPEAFAETPCIAAEVRGRATSNCAVIRVTAQPLGLSYVTFSQPDVRLVVATEAGGFPHAALLDDRNVPEGLNAGYGMLRELTGATPFFGGLQYFVEDPGHGADGTVPCGLSGNPIRLGTDIDKPIHNSCLIIAFPPAVPQWGVMLHEMAHNFNGSLIPLQPLLFAADSQMNYVFVEGLTTVAAIAVTERLIADVSAISLPGEAVAELQAERQRWRVMPPLQNYEAGGAIYATMNPDVLTQIFSELMDEFGPGFVYRFYSVFSEAHASGLPAAGSGSERATLLVSAASAAAESDLRNRFAARWGFPIDAAWWATNHATIVDRAALRDPVPYAGQDRTTPAGVRVAIDDATVFDWEGDDPGSVRWRMISAPPGGALDATSWTAVSLAVCASAPGEYVLGFALDGPGPSLEDTLVLSVTAGTSAGCRARLFAPDITRSP